MEKFKEILKLTQLGLKKYLFKELTNLYENDSIINHPKFLYAKGEVPILLIAHLDTVHKQPIKTILHDTTQNLMWSPEGIGGDDRCGVYTILSLLKKGYKPHVLFTTDEEIGGYGAKAFVKYFEKNELHLLSDLKYLIQLDRKGENDSVYYNCNNKTFKQYIDKFGFEEDYGSFSDISIIAPYCEVAAVNLSIGYYNEHRLYEYINVNHMIATMDKIEQLILDVENCPIYEYHINYSYEIDDDVQEYYNQLYKRSQLLKEKNPQTIEQSIDKIYPEQTLYHLFGKPLPKTKDKD